MTERSIESSIHPGLQVFGKKERGTDSHQDARSPAVSPTSGLGTQHFPYRGLPLGLLMGPTGATPAFAGEDCVCRDELTV